MSAQAPTNYTLYVTATRTTTYNASNCDGSVTNPFEDLEDAILKAEDLCAPYKKCFVSIYLNKGIHYLLRKPWNFYKRKFKTHN